MTDCDRFREGSHVHLQVPDELIDRIADAVIVRLTAAGHAPASVSPWLNVEKAAVYLTCSTERVRKLVQRREIPFHQDQPGGRVFFNRRELDEWMLEK